MIHEDDSLLMSANPGPVPQRERPAGPAGTMVRMVAFVNNALEDKLRSYLQLYWLRPENALLCTFKSEAFADLPLRAPCLDISCGDGLFMFIHLGGVLGDDFDYFTATRADQFSHASFVDIYDACDHEVAPEVRVAPPVTIDCGTDWKAALLDKARGLKLYDRLLRHDNNITPLPLKDGSFQTVYSNALYWTDNVEQLVGEIHRILRPGGLAILEVMTPYFLHTLQELEPYLSGQALHILDRDRRRTMPGGRPYRAWLDLVRSSGLELRSCRCVYPHRALLDIWNIGLRPVSHLLIQMADQLTPVQRRRIKREWVEIFFELFKPLLKLPRTYELEQAPYLLLVLGR